ncbi:MAG: hypothetical protein H6Q70_204 [Firmicutes bacterium]|nr:hypothetical protein [Bacillota bacterium]
MHHIFSKAFLGRKRNDGVGFLRQNNIIRLFDLLREQILLSRKYLQYLDGIIAFLAIVLCIFTYQYFNQDMIEKYIVAGIFVVIALYYSAKLWRRCYQPIAAYNSNISTILMLNDNGNVIKQWDIQGKVSLLIGKNKKNKDVDIDLSESMYDALIYDEHALLNFAANNWYLEGLHVPSSVSLKKNGGQMRYRLTGNRPCKVAVGDMIYIANTRLMIK